jgi:hypothetical protein
MSIHFLRGTYHADVGSVVNSLEVPAASISRIEVCVWGGSEFIHIQIFYFERIGGGDAPFGPIGTVDRESCESKEVARTRVTECTPH